MTAILPTHSDRHLVQGHLSFVGQDVRPTHPKRSNRGPAKLDRGQIEEIYLGLVRANYQRVNTSERDGRLVITGTSPSGRHNVCLRFVQVGSSHLYTQEYQ